MILQILKSGASGTSQALGRMLYGQSEHTSDFGTLQNYAGQANSISKSTLSTFNLTRVLV